MSARVGTLALEGAVTFASYNSVLQALQAFLADGGGVVDWQRVSEVDSSAISLIFHGQRLRRADAPGLRHAHLPRALDALAELYGVSALLASGEAAPD